MNFKKYPSIENHYRDKYVSRWLNYYPELQFEEFIIVEKIHGANFQILIDKDSVKFASRNMMLKEDSNFFGYQEVMDKYEDMIETFKGIIDEKTESIRVFGELFGSNIQKGVDYGEDKKFKIFDIYINDELLSQFDALYFLAQFNMRHNFVPILEIVVGLDEALKFDTEFNTKLSDKEDNICEGVVIKPYGKVYEYDENSPFFLKKKNKSFMEKQKSKGTKRNTPSSKFVEVQGLFNEYITENRIQGVFSKHGEIHDPKQIREYIKLTMNDARDDFLKDNMEELNQLEDKEKRGVFSSSGRIIASILQEYL